MCSELTPRAPIPDTRIPQLMQPWAWVTSKAPHTLLWVIVAWYLIPSMIVQNKSLAIFRKEISCVRTKNIKELACLIFMLHIWLWVGGLRTWGRYGILVWNIGGDRRHTPTIVPTTHQIHYPVTTKNTFRKLLNVKIVHREQGTFCPPKNCSGIFSPWHPVFRLSSLSAFVVVCL